MSKVMLVEDDNNLREIYGARLEAEGYDIVSAKDGEEALALAVQEKPDLIISDVMMPRISGFDMLDILRNAPETKNTKVIMMTALSQAEDKARADKLGADRYLVKSQVTLEDVANVVHEVLEGAPTEAAAPAAPAVQPADPTPAPPTPAPESVEAIANPVVEVHDEPNPADVQIPPQDTSDVPLPPAPTGNPDPNPLPLPNTADTAPELVAPSAAPSAPATDDSLPPIVQPATPITVQMPQMPTPQQPTQTAPIAPTPDPVQPSAPAQDFVGPNLAQALASEEAITTTPQVTGSDMSVPSVPAPTVITPTQPLPAPQPGQPEVQAAPAPQISNSETEATVETNNNIAGMRVIQPIGNPTAKPDLNQLLENEQRDAAVQNPSANTIITPQPPVQTQQNLEVKEAPKQNDFDKFSL